MQTNLGSSTPEKRQAASWAAVRAPPSGGLLECWREKSATPPTNRKEVGGLTVMVAHPSTEEAAKVLLPDLYEAPIAEVEHVERETESYVAWVIVLGFVAYAIALYWAHKCKRRGGDPSITFSALKGFIVKCRK